jgi:triosephosphate isomerase
MRPLVAGNWKMNTSLDEARSLAEALVSRLANVSDTDVVVCPPYPWLTEVSRVVAASNVRLGAQNMHYQPGGGLTGEVSPQMLRGLCDFVLIGHYERRVLLKETEWLVNQKVQAALQHGIRPILCVGDTVDQLEEGQSAAAVAQQLESAIKGIDLDERLAVAYDPAWTTIGKSPPVPPGFMNDICGYIRDCLEEFASPAAAAKVRILCGGSIGSRNLADLSSQPNFDGFLTGSASLRVDDFVAIVDAASHRVS